MKIAIAILLLLALPSLAIADLIYHDAITFGPAYASGPPAGFPWGSMPDYGDPFIIFGMVTQLAAPLAGLVPGTPHEITCVWDGAECTEWGNYDGPCSGGNYGMFAPGTFAVYLDVTPDADFANPSSFRDGEQVLLAQVDGILVADDDPAASCPMVDDVDDVRSSFTFIGGTWFNQVSNAGTGFLGLSGGEIQYSGNVPPDLQSLGYVLRIDGSVDIYAPVATQQTTWGRVKAMYR